MDARAEPRALDQRLLKAVVEVGSKPYRNPRANPPALIVPVREALEAGANPNAEDAQGRDAFQLLGQMVGNNANAAALTVARMLIDHGYQVVERRGIEQLSGNLREGVMMHLATLARQGAPVLGRHGQTHLHGLAERHLSVLTMFILKDVGAAPAKHLVPSQLLSRGRASDGATAAHLLWRAQASSGEAGEALEPVRWLATYLMSRHKGLCLAMADTAGRWVLDDLLDHLQASGWPSDKDMDVFLANKDRMAFLAQTQAQMLERQTCVAPNMRTGRGIRL